MRNRQMCMEGQSIRLIYKTFICLYFQSLGPEIQDLMLVVKQD